MGELQRLNRADTLGELGLTDAETLALRNAYPDAPADALGALAIKAKRMGLDPLTGQVMLVGRPGKSGQSWTVQVGIDGLRAVADRCGNYCPGSLTTYEVDKRGNLVSATAYVRKYCQGEWLEFGETRYLADFNTGRNLWAKMPRVMLAKCAEAAALRKGWPHQLHGVYIPEEMEQGDAAPSRTKPTPKPKAPAPKALPAEVVTTSAPSERPTVADRKAILVGIWRAMSSTGIKDHRIIKGKMTEAVVEDLCDRLDLDIHDAMERLSQAVDGTPVVEMSSDQLAYAWHATLGGDNGQ